MTQHSISNAKKNIEVIPVRKHKVEVRMNERLKASKSYAPDNALSFSKPTR
jgi:hypothetical protein